MRGLALLSLAFLALAGIAQAQPLGAPNAPSVAIAPNIVANPGGVTTDTSVTPANVNQQCLREASATTPPGPPGAPNEYCAFFSIDVPSGHGGNTIGVGSNTYEDLALYLRAQTDDPNLNGVGAYDTGPMDAQVTFKPGGHCQTTISGSNGPCREFGLHSLCTVPAGTDGIVSCGESEIANSGPDQPLIDNPTSKLTLHPDCLGPNNCTAILESTAAGGAKFDMGLMVRAGDVVSTAPAFGVISGGTSAANTIGGLYPDGHVLATDYTLGASAIPAGREVLLGKLIGVNANITTDQAIALTCPTLANVSRVVITNASTSLTTVQGGIYAAASKTTPLFNTNTTTAYTWLTAATRSATIGGGGASASTGGSQDAITCSASGQIFFSFTTGQGGAATFDAYVFGERLQ